MQYIPLNSYIIVKLVEHEEVRESGLIIQSVKTQSVVSGLVIACEQESAHNLDVNSSIVYFNIRDAEMLDENTYAILSDKLIAKG